MSLLALPPDMLRLVLSFLGTRSLLNAAATCTTLRDMVNAMALHPTMTSQTRMLHWLQRPTVAPRVRTLTARYSSAPCTVISVELVSSITAVECAAV